MFELTKEVGSKTYLIFVLVSPDFLRIVTLNGLNKTSEDSQQLHVARGKGCKQSKIKSTLIQANLTGLENFDACFYVIFDRHWQSFTFEIFLIFPNFLKSISICGATFTQNFSY